MKPNKPKGNDERRQTGFQLRQRLCGAGDRCVRVVGKTVRAIGETKGSKGPGPKLSEAAVLMMCVPPLEKLGANSCLRKIKEIAATPGPRLWSKSAGKFVQFLNIVYIIRRFIC